MRNGKIAKLTSTLRDDLNVRMANGEDGPELLAWLNGLPEVQESLKAHFGGVPISKQNLCEWRQGGFREWQRHEEWTHQACELNHYTTDLKDVVDTPLLAGDLAALLAVRYAALLNTWDGEADPEFEQRLRLLRGLGQDIALMQRTLHRASLQQIAHYQHFEDDLQKHSDKMKQIALSHILAGLERQSLEQMFALFTKGKQAKKLAELVTAVKYDQPWRKSANRSHPGQTQSNPVKPQKVV
jgi:hypothetical protein